MDGGLAATAGIFIGLAAAIAVVLAGTAWIVARTRRPDTSPADGPVAVAAPTRRARE